MNMGDIENENEYETYYDMDEDFNIDELENDETQPAHKSV